MHGYTPSELLFGFNPRQGQLDLGVRETTVACVLAHLTTPPGEFLDRDAGGKMVGDSSARLANEYIARNLAARLTHLDEIRNQAALAAIEQASKAPVRRTQWDALKENDLILLR